MQQTTTFDVNNPYTTLLTNNMNSMSQMQMPMMIAQLMGQQTPFSDANLNTQDQNMQRLWGRYNMQGADPMKQFQKQQLAESPTMPDMDIMAKLFKMYGMGQPGQGGVNTTTQNNPGMIDYLQTAGSIAGIASLFCWVAREVYGVDNPRWIIFKTWLEFHAPKWFFILYQKHGERFAGFISDKPMVKKFIRMWMDTKVNKMKEVAYA